MRIRTILFAFGSVLLASTTLLFAQGLQNKSGFGFNGGANYLFGDAEKSVPGFSAGIMLAYRITDRVSLNVNTGYGTFGYKTNNAVRNSVSNFIYGNLTLDFELTVSRFRPFLLAGAGGVNFRSANSPDRFYDGEILAGAGVRLFLFQNIAFSISASGNYTTGDDLDGIAMGGKDIYAAIRTGFTFYKARRPSRRIDRDDYFTDQLLWNETNENTTEDEPVDFFRKNLLDAEKKRDEENLAKHGLRRKYNDANIGDLAIEAFFADTTAKSKIPDRSDEWLFSTFDDENTVPGGESWRHDMQVDLPQKNDLENQTNHVKNRVPEAEGSDFHVRTHDQQDQRERNVPFNVAYENALDTYRNRNYLAAIEEFKALVAREPNHNLVSNCEYWIGECYYGLAQYEKALITFERVLNAYLVSSKMDDALIMQGLVYMKLGREKEAGLAFRRLLTIYPNSEYALKAKQYLKKLRA